MLDKTLAFLEMAERPFMVDQHEVWQEAMAEVRAIKALPEIVLLVGSSKFKMVFESESERLTLDGKIILGRHVYKPGNEWDLPEAHRDMIHAVQFRKLDISDRLHIVNVDGYIGSDTYNVIKYAIKQDKPITFYNEHVQVGKAESLVTTHHFMQATRATVNFEGAVHGE